ncbi:MAG: transcriptional regulator [Lysobacteraceae bacterium]|nr:MAG: transcriptional regulator [Xanthomonadaceae bacterium]
MRKCAESHAGVTVVFQIIPPLRALRAFEAAARHMSFTAAAAELHLTQAAISHQIKVLEERLEIKLFRRFNRSLELTEAGQMYLPAVRDALTRLAQGTERLLSQLGHGVLTVSVLPSFASKWLVPRLWRFRDMHPEIDVRVSAFEWLVDFEKDGIDVAIRYGAGNWAGVRADPLLTEDVFPVCSPALLTGDHPLRKPSDLRFHTLLHDDFSREDWKLWLLAVGNTSIDPSRGLSFSHTSMMLEAALSGHGVALGRTPLVQDDLINGRLVKPFELSLQGDYAYYVVTPEEQAHLPKVVAFREWLMSEVATPAQTTDAA